MSNLIHESLSLLPALTAASIAASGVGTGEFTDMAGRSRFCFAVGLGAVEEAQGVKVELLSSAASDGSTPTVEADITYTAPAGGVTKHLVQVSGRVTPDRGRYLAVRVTNLNTGAAVLASAVLATDFTYHPEDAGGTTLVV